MFKSALITTLPTCCREIKVKLAEKIEEVAKWSAPSFSILCL